MQQSERDEIEEMWSSVQKLFQLPLPLFADKASNNDIEKKVRHAMQTTKHFKEWSIDFKGRIVGDFALVEPYLEYELTGKRVFIDHVSVCVDIVDESSRYRLTISCVSPCSSINSWNRIFDELVHAMSSFCIPNQGLLT